ncbi:MAG: ATP-binding cassette domain-containing protein [Gammaproteobacteria bacterium]|nr:ATP-binding cassette domain-containing protein [Gammaproteobacteria bacterium]
MISIQGLTKTYASGTQAVNKLDLEVNSGEILALLGPNGAGKSTTIKVLTTLSGFDEGKATVAGHDVDKEPDLVRQAIGYVAQETGIDYFLTGRENLRLHGQMYRMSKRDIAARIEELAEYFDLSKYLDELVSGYSGGMRRKLDIATALIHRPKVLFLDEPTLGLDTKSRQSLWKYINKLNEELGLTILLTTHYLEEADKLSDRVAIIDQGVIKIIDTPEALKTSIKGDVVSMEFADESEEMQNFAWSLKEQDYVKEGTWESDKYHIYVSNGAEAIPKVMQAATEAGVKVINISFARPTLDDVFIKYTGSSLQGDKEEGGEEWWHQWAGKGGGGSGKWAKQWQKWQDVEEEESAATDKQWPQQEQWSQKANTTTQDAAAENTGAEDNATEQQWPQQQNWNQEASSQDSDQKDWQKEAQKWQQSDSNDKPADSGEQQWPDKGNWPNDSKKD